MRIALCGLEHGGGWASTASGPGGARFAVAVVDQGKSDPSSGAGATDGGHGGAREGQLLSAHLPPRSSRCHCLITRSAALPRGIQPSPTAGCPSDGPPRLLCSRGERPIETGRLCRINVLKGERKLGATSRVWGEYPVLCAHNHY